MDFGEFVKQLTTANSNGFALKEGIAWCTFYFRRIAVDELMLLRRLVMEKSDANRRLYTN